ncbi:hypothetical protein [Caldinitratiruptor microaerophilus]|uniref:Uncharacterized protein n=1 Tax=Caldinitratiruptor microaerophilus TaxID=671077 RepID=A0AA35CKM4_9FIRM|nr:hypothetical protein [Caldinitratiruptor microaerophilus]BDG60264.1 hypothetical protein caldi_13540 [Caldinitratiruptor microaerophilus]
MIRARVEYRGCAACRRLHPVSEMVAVKGRVVKSAPGTWRPGKVLVIGEVCRRCAGRPEALDKVALRASSELVTFEPVREG